MNEEQLADLLAQHLDTLLEGRPLPETLPAEVADLLSVAHSLSEAAPVPRPEFGPALKETLLGPTGGGNGTPPSAGSVFGGQMGLVVVVGLLVGAAVLALLISVAVFIVAGVNLSGTPTPAPQQTQTSPALPPPITPTQTASPTTISPTPDAGLNPTVTTTPIIDVLPVITVTIEIVIEPPDLVPGSGSGGGGSGGNDGGGGDDGGDHDRGHGNDPDHHDEDNPGNSGDDD